MTKTKWGLIILVLGIMLTGYGGLCKKKKDKDVISGSSSSGTLPAAQVTSPNPADEMTDVPITQPLGWAAANGATSYDVYFGITTTGWSPVTNTVLTSFNPSVLQYLTAYYWQIDSKNSAGTTTGNVWDFQTEAEPVMPPVQVTSPAPANEATDVPCDQQLGWAAANGATSYDVYFDTFTPPTTKVTTTTGTSYDPGTLSSNTIYYWRIDSKNEVGTTSGEIWSFQTTTPPAQVTSPNPSNGKTDFPCEGQPLRWAPASRATSYDVYFGTSSSPSYKTNTSGTSYNPGYKMDTDTNHYWRIDAKNSAGITPGQVWWFETT